MNVQDTNTATEEVARVRRIAELAVGTCAGVREGERLLVLTDTGGDPRLAAALATVGRGRGAEVIVLEFTQVSSINDIPQRVKDAMTSSDVVIPVCKSRILYSPAVAETRRRGRMLYMADVPTELLMRPVVLEADYDELARFKAAFAEILGGDPVMRVESAAGTSATMQMLAGRNLALSICRSHNPGDHDYLPGGAWFGCPLESSVNGTFVVDSSIEPGVAGGLLAEGIALTYRDGRLVAVEGGAQAREFESWLRSCDDEIWGFSHNGGGFNRKAAPTGNLMEDERILGTFCVAGGANTLRWSGTNSSAFHFDGMVLSASYWVDDVPVCEAGTFVHPRLREAARTG